MRLVTPWEQFRAHPVHLQWFGAHAVAAGLAHIARHRRLNAAELEELQAWTNLRDTLQMAMGLIFEPDTLERLYGAPLIQLYYEADRCTVRGLSVAEINAESEALIVRGLA